jgi:hypothetical protein
VETGGYINRRAHLFLDVLQGSEGSRLAADSHFRGPSPQDVALRGVMQALVRIQAYSLADMVVAILAEDLAVGRQRCEEGSESEIKVCVAFAPSLSWLPCLILPKHTGGSQCK